MNKQFSPAGIATGAEALTAGLSPAALAYAEAQRGISRPTLEKLGVVSGMAFFPSLERKSDAVRFPYRAAGEVVNVKSAAFPEKAFAMIKGGKLAFFNLEPVLASQAEAVYLTEGEWDAAALVEAGVPVDQVLSVPNGARERKGSGGYDFVDEALKAGLGRKKRFVWCGDMDGPGLALRHDMARILGTAKFWFADWPTGCKDANDCLLAHGARIVREIVRDGAHPWPADGLFRLSEMPEPPPLDPWHPGFPEWEDKVLLAPRTLSVFTGQPGHGKTSLAMQIWFQICRQYGVSAFVTSFETRAKPHHRRALRTLFTGKLEKYQSEAEIKQADAFIERHFLWGVHPQGRPTLDWWLDLAEIAVVRHGARIVQLDPWNRLEAARARDESETEYIGRCLRTVHAFAQDFNCHVQLLAHPAKLHGDKRGRIPELEDISGSKNWDNMVDQGFVIHRPEVFGEGGRKTAAKFYCKKSRFSDELGYPCVLNMNYNLQLGRYESTDYANGAGFKEH